MQYTYLICQFEDGSKVATTPSRISKSSIARPEGPWTYQSDHHTGQQVGEPSGVMINFGFYGVHDLGL